MEAMYPQQVSAVQVGSYFVRQYYEIIQQNPHVGHQFYSEASTVIRIDGEAEQTANSMMQIHTLLTTLNIISIEIKTLHSLSSWDRGVLVMVSGFVQMKEYNGRRKFVQTFFLAPQEKGYFVLNDIFQLLDEETTFQPVAVGLARDNYESSADVANHHIPDPALGYTIGEEIQTGEYESPVDVLEEELQAREHTAPLHADEREYEELQASEYAAPHHADEYATPFHADEIDTIDEYSIPEPQHQQISQVDERVDEIPIEELVASFPSAVNMVREPPASAEPAGERPKQTYASILRLAKAQPGNSMPRVAPVRKTTQAVTDTQPAAPQQSYPTTSLWSEEPISEVVEDVTAAEDEGEVKSVYVRNLSSSVSASDLELEFKNFGRIRPNGVTVRSRKDSGGFYAFVEFEDAASVQNALQASPILLNGRPIYVEERKPNSSLSRVGGGRGRGRGRGGYPSEAPRGRFGGSRARGNGVLQRVPRQERGILGNHAMRNGQSPSDASY